MATGGSEQPCEGDRQPKISVWHCLTLLSDPRMLASESTHIIQQLQGLYVLSFDSDRTLGVILLMGRLFAQLWGKYYPQVFLVYIPLVVMCGLWLGWSLMCWSQVRSPTPLENAKTKGNWDQCVMWVECSNRGIIFIHLFFHGIFHGINSFSFHSLSCSEEQGVLPDKTIQTGINYCSWIPAIKIATSKDEKGSSSKRLS